MGAGVVSEFEYVLTKDAESTGSTDSTKGNSFFETSTTSSGAVEKTAVDVVACGVEITLVSLISPSNCRLISITLR